MGHSNNVCVGGGRQSVPRAFVNSGFNAFLVKIYIEHLQET
jgi:hypothetical protein